MIFLALVALAAIAALAYEKHQTTVREREWTAERATLLNRIQAPEIAVLPEQQMTPYVAPEDDQGYWDAVEERVS